MTGATPPEALLVWISDPSRVSIVPLANAMYCCAVLKLDPP